MKKCTCIIVLMLWLSLSGFAPVQDSRRVPVIMYHSVCRTNVGEYVISPDTLISDLEYLRKRGYKTVFMRDIISYCEGKTELPEKPVVLTFDDGFYNNLFYVDKIAEKYGVKYTVSVVGSYVRAEAGQTKRSPVYSYLSPAEIGKLSAGGRAEIANHTYDMHRSSPRKGVRRKKSESYDEYRTALIYDSEKCRTLIYEACGFKTNVFTYPFGCYSTGTKDILHELGYRAILTCKGGINVFTKGKTDGLDCVMRYNRHGKSDTKEFFEKIKVL